MMYLCNIFVRPLHFRSQRKWGGFFLSSILYGFAYLGVLTIVGAMIAPLFWILALGYAGFAHRKEPMAVQADLVATKIAKKMKGH